MGRHARVAWGCEGTNQRARRCGFLSTRFCFLASLLTKGRASCECRFSLQTKTTPLVMAPRSAAAGLAPGASVATIFTRAQDATPAAAARLAALLWAHAAPGDAFLEELVSCVNHLLTVPVVSECGREEASARVSNARASTGACGRAWRGPILSLLACRCLGCKVMCVCVLCAGSEAMPKPV